MGTSIYKLDCFDKMPLYLAILFCKQQYSYLLPIMEKQGDDTTLKECIMQTQRGLV